MRLRVGKRTQECGMHSGRSNVMQQDGDAGLATDIEAIGRLVRQRTLEAVALHFAVIGEAAASQVSVVTHVPAGPHRTKRTTR